MRIALMTAAGVALAMAQPVFAQTATADAPGTVARAGDDGLTCPQMADEAATISASMGDEGPGLLGRAVGVARAGASLLVPGAGLALAGADALTGSGEDRKAAEARTKRDRWNYLNGLYAGRGCGETEAQAPTAPVSAPNSARSPMPVAAPTVTPAGTPTVARVAPPPPAITPAAFPH